MNDTTFRMPQMRLIKKRFDSLDTEGKGYVTVEDVMAGVPNLSWHSLSERILDTLLAYDNLPDDADFDENTRIVDFHAFVRAIDLFKTKNSS